MEDRDRWRCGNAVKMACNMNPIIAEILMPSFGSDKASKWNRAEFIDITLTFFT